ncbi:MAG: RimK family alpha-L-glutamate ligase [Gemmatimonadota bacterium]
MRPLSIIILASRTGWHTDRLVRALAQRGHTASLLPYEGLVGRLGRQPGMSNGASELDHADAILARIIPAGSLEQIIYRVDALHRLEDRGVLILNTPGAIERSVDKFYTSALLEQAGLATPETVVCERAEDAFAAFRTMGDVIVKPLFGSMGLGMVRVSDEEIAFRVFRAVEMVRGIFYLQRFIEHDGADIRAFVVGDRVVGAIERRAPGWRTNISRGGEARVLTLPAEWERMALTAARAVGADYAGVDLLPAKDGTVYLLEVNGIPGWEGLERATGIDVAGTIADHLLARYTGRNAPAALP